MTGVDTGLSRWLALVEHKDPARLPELVAEQAVFRSPAVFAPQPGRALVVAYLTAAMEVLGPGLTYRRQWRNDTGVILEFVSELDGREIHGVDMIEFDEDGRIVDFTVMVRPLSALNKVIEHMSQALSRLAPN